ncbi:MAG: hypothetical protein CVU64_08790 [Deltaproteobacteria bacterium HGW-Deltaproteobacteria-21]|nr:MAG: hypothetical protein CVU64_08790 [Deltaproteobacteria bacterium HGW-Deltaproteobacteria-21]
MAQERKKFFKRFAALTALVCILIIKWEGVADASSGVQIGQNTEVVFGTLEEGKRILGVKDEYVERMSPFDRSARMKINREVSTQDFIEFVSTKVRSWESGEKELIESALLGIRGGLVRAGFPDLGIIFLIKTTGEEEGNRAYTRGNAVVLPQSMIRDRKIDLKRLLAHELFHILSRNLPMMRSTLYEAIGFRYCGDLDFPPSLSRITNPDAPRNDHVILVSVNGEPALVMPILFSRTTVCDVQSNRDLSDYLQFGLLRVTKGETADSVRPMVGKDGPVLLGAGQVELLFDQVGRNTDYIIHPEEILADNFALLVLGEEHVPRPEILSMVKNSLLSKEEK